MYKVNDKIKLKGTSNKGKNRISQYGDVFYIRRIQGGHLLVNTIDDKDSRWIMKNLDPDFEIVE